LLRVQDSAPGVPEAALEQVFEPLFRADQARSRHAQQAHGSGLGLAIVRAIVRAHQGQVTARHSALGGLCLEVWLPLQAQDQHFQEKTQP
jgi:two-component system sensor histidine kinase BaeS